MQNHRSLNISWEKIHLLCIKQGIAIQELAKLTGLSRSTLNNWAKGKITKPHIQKINVIAHALKVPVEEILAADNQQHAAKLAHNVSIPRDVNDQQHNRQIVEVVQEMPVLFHHWTSQDWDELYSEFGVGGALTSHGVKHSAQLINRKKEVFRKLEMVMESDLADVAESMINCFFSKIKADPVNWTQNERDHSQL